MSSIMNSELNIKNLSKEFVDRAGYKKKLIQNISFDVSAGNITTVLAPTGTGKSSLLKIISGLDSPTSGEVLKTGNGKIIYIPSEPSSFPWMSVQENILLALEKKEDVKKYISLVGLEGYGEHIPDNKSLGFRFRISLARALALKPAVIVLDEPFGKMDPITKGEIYNLIHKINKNEKQTILLGTTNITEAIYLSDKIVLMKKDPCEVLEEIEVNLSAERSLELLDKVEFNALREKIEKIYKEYQSASDSGHAQKLFNLSI